MYIQGIKHIHNGKKIKVMEVLVFASQAASKIYEAMLDRGISVHGFKNFDPIGIGAAYIVRAVHREDTNEWRPIVRCGFTGIRLCYPFSPSRKSSKRNGVNDAV